MSGPVINIAERPVGPGAPCFVIAEVAQAHDGSLGFAHAFIDVARDCGVDAIKFQTHIAAAETTPLEQFRVNFSYEDRTRFDYWRRMEFTAEQWSGLADHARKAGLIFLSSPFSLEAFELLDTIGVPAWKVASGEITNQPLLDAMASTGKPVMLSTGLAALPALAARAATITSRGAPLAIFQCTTKYPTPLEEVGLNVLPQLRTQFCCPVGLSDHSGSIFPSLAAMAQGADMIEIHVALHRRHFGPDTVASVIPDELSLIVQARDAFHTMARHPVDKDEMAESVAHLARLFGKSVALKSDQPAGTVLVADMLTTKKPGTGLPPDRLPALIGRSLARDVSASELLIESDLK